MKKLLAILLALTLAINNTAPLQAYTSDDLKQIEKITAVALAGCAAFQMFAPEEALMLQVTNSEQFNARAALGFLRKVTAYSTSSSDIMPAVRVAEKIATVKNHIKDGIHVSRSIDDEDFWRDVAIAGSIGVTEEIVNVIQGKIMTETVCKITSNTIALRIADAVTTALAFAGLDVGASVTLQNLAPESPYAANKNFQDSFMAILIEELAYHFLAELINHNAQDSVSSLDVASLRQNLSLAD